MDVLQNYMTYKKYYKIAKIIEDNPEFDTTAGSKAIINYETLHPHNISQKTAIMLEHFMNVTRHKIGGRAKAMVVTPSRLHAVRYVQEFKRQIKEKGLNDLEVLVAFSGEVKDNDDVFTEEGMNKDKEGKTIKEKALPETFHADDYGILVVAEKYQTGFDEPLLHTMFVDKKLSGVKAVQTLSRLNRTTRGKVDTFVLDFVNSAEDIKASFEPFYEETVLLEETDPNVVYDMKNTLDDFRVYQKSEVDKFADIFYQSENQSAGDLGKLQGQLRPAIDRYEVLEVEKQDIFKSTLASFNRVYAYITQVCRLFDKDIHRFSIYSKFLYTMLPKGHGGEKINIDDKVLLEYYKLEKDFEGPIELESTEGGYTPISGDSGHREPKKDPLTVIIDKINEKYGTHFTEMDKVLVQMENDYANQEKWQSYAKNNDRATFMLLFEKDFPNMAADRYEQNDQFFRKLFDDPDMMRQVMETVGSVLYERLKKKYIFDPKSGVIEEATPETYVEATYLTKKEGSENMQLGWIDFSKEDRQKAFDVINLLSEQGAVDELGIGVIRDAFANYFFPGTSTFQTRAKYFLIVLYMLREAVDGRYGKDANRVLRAIDSAEKDCGIRLLEADPKAEGVIGSRVLPKGWVARKPSDIYWNGIRTFGIFCDYGLSIPEYVSLAVKLKEQKSVSRLGNRNDDAEENDKDDSDAGDIGNIRFWNLPIYHDDWRDNLTIELTQEEAFYLDKQIQKSTKGSLLEYVLKNRIDLNEYDDFASLTAELSEKVGEKLAYMMKLACDFNNLVYMARVRYNVMLSEDENTYARATLIHYPQSIL